MIKKIKDNLFSLMLMLLIPITNIFYGVLNNSNRGVYSLVTDLDRIIPFSQVFILPYMLWYPFILLTLVYFCFYYKEVYYKTLSTLILGMVLCYVVYFFFQTTVPRPELIGDDILTKIIGIVYKSDNPYNCFPSIHVLTSYAMIIGMRKSGSSNLKVNNLVSFTAWLIIISTLLVKQHVILDVVFGIVFADGAYRIVDNFNLKRCLLWIKKPSWWWMMKKKLET
ncbi:phosphatase PAP2 family protein [Clostridium sp. UBA4548]|uniref:phosphatase PAP2 family protein n=1 Tax=Clostridium sp. UBA4548 TaxID=1946361 RepID=UPI0025C4CCFE|nr:phosphatase PAP2 family protein [Clostridium sp. UBA4548]